MNRVQKLFIAFILSSGLSGVILAQNARMDSLERVVGKSSGTQEVDITNRLAFEWYLYSVEKSYEYSSRALVLAEKLHYTRGIAEATIYKGIYESLTGNPGQAKNLLLKGKAFAREANARGLEGYALIQLGNMQRGLGNYDSALHYYGESYQILKDSLNPWYLGSLYGNLSKYYGLISKPDTELKYLRRAYNIREHLNDPVVFIDALVLLSAWYTKNYDIEKAKSYLDRAEKLVSKDTQTEIRIDIKFQKGIILFHLGNFDEALSLFEEVKSYYAKNSTPQVYVKSLNNIGKTFEQLGNYEASLRTYFEAIKIAEEKKFSLELSKLNIGIGWDYYLLKHPDLAVQFKNKGLALAKANKYQHEQAESYNLSGLIFISQGNYDEALKETEKALTIRQEINDKAGIAESLDNLGDIFEAKGELKEALKVKLQGLELEESLLHKQGTTWSYISLARLYTKLNNYRLADTYLLKAEKNARFLKSGELLLNVLLSKRDLLEVQGNSREALQVSKRYETLKDSVFHSTLTNRISNLQGGYELDQKNKEIELLQKNKQLQENELALQKAKVRQQWFIIAFVATGLFFFGIVVVLLYRNNEKTKQLNKEIHERNEEIQAQSEELTESNTMLGIINKTLNEKQDEIAAQNEELIQNNEEISAQRDMVNLQKSKLEQAHQIIEKQNNEIKLRNENLELEVANRTKELVEYNQQLEQFAFISSHNLRAPVARILGLGQLLDLAGTTTDDERLIKEKLIFTTRELDQVVRDLNSILEIKRNSNTNATEVDVAQALQFIIESFANEIHEYQIEIKTDFSSTSSIRTVKPYLDSIIFNLVSNAIKYRNPERRPMITLRTEFKDNYACLIVSDNGLGIDLQKYKNKIFTLYSRFHDHVEGKGLGLYLVKTQIASLGGKIDVTSEVGKGTTFSIYFKMA